MQTDDNKIRLAPRAQCTGCGLCANVCSCNAITMAEDSYGFSYPQIDDTLCNQCNRCADCCPILHPPEGYGENAACYAAWAADGLRACSTSGGIFSALAESTLGEGGVVFGAIMDECLRVRHVAAQNADELAELRGSKYVQSDMGGIYREVERFLAEGRKVLFSGCPCQVAALRSFLQTEHEGLLLVDLLCHGVPSQKMFLDYLAENFNIESIDKIKFRDKRNGWAGDHLVIYFKDGSLRDLSYRESCFEMAYHQSMSQREACFECPFCGLARQGDITIGDFWGIDDYRADWNDHKGTSVLFVNNSRGSQAFEQVRPSLTRVEEVPIKYCEINRIREILPAHPDRNRFFGLLRNHTFSVAADYALHKKYDVGVIGCWSVENHGSNLSYYALYRVLCGMGLETLMIERPLDSLWRPNTTPTGFLKNPYNVYDLAPLFPDKPAMKMLNEQCDTFVLGSDQLLFHDLYRSFSEFIDLRYIHANKRKIAYATSLGREQFEGTEDQRASLSLWLGQFDAVSVREQDGVGVLKDTFGVDADFVLDPVFLCPKEAYNAMAELAPRPCPKPFIAAYVVDPDPSKETALRFFQAGLGLELRVFSDVSHKPEQVEKAWALPTDITASNEAWLRGIIDCDFFVTDSYHGVCFAILYHKPFVCIANRRRGITRFTSLLSRLGLMHRMVTDASAIPENRALLEPIDYAAVDTVLQADMDRSLRWLRQALAQKAHKPLSAYDVVDDRVDGLEKRLAEALARIANLENWVKVLDERNNRNEQILADAQSRTSNAETWLKSLDDRVNLDEQALADVQNRLGSLEASSNPEPEQAQ